MLKATFHLFTHVPHESAALWATLASRQIQALILGAETATVAVQWLYRDDIPHAGMPILHILPIPYR
jgi:hypothetical protein